MKHHIITLFGVSFVLAACGGGGGGGGGGGQLATASITTANAQNVSQVAIDKSLGLVSVTGASSGALGARLEGSERGIDLKGFVRRRVQQMLVAPVMSVVLVEERPGAQGGRAIATWDDRDDSHTISTGDTFLIVFEAFREEGVTLNGRLGIDQMVVVGDPEADPTWRLGARFFFDGLSGSEAGETVILDGALSIDAEQTPTLLHLALELQASLTDGTATLFGGNALVYEEDNANLFTLDSRGAIGDSTIGGVVTFETTTPFGGSTQDDFPSRGVLVVTGAGGARVTITVLDNTSIRIEVDTNGDGAIDDSRTMQWSAL